MSHRRICTTIAWVVGLLLGGATPAPAQSTTVLARAELSTNEIGIGDRVSFTLTISAPPGTRVERVDWRSSKVRSGAPTDPVADPLQEENGLPASLEVVDSSALSTIAEEPELLLEERWTLQAFDTGYVFVPARMVVYTLAGAGGSDTTYTEALLLTVRGIPLNEESELMPIEPIVKTRLNWLDFWPFYLFLLLIGVGVGIWYVVARKDHLRLRQPPPPPVPPHRKAQRALDELEARELWQAGETKTYYSELSHILRTYLEGRFGIPALETTTRQIVGALSTKSGFDPGLGEELSQLLRLSDLVKFARAEPEADVHQRGLERVRDFVRLTVPHSPSQEEE